MPELHASVLAPPPILVPASGGPQSPSAMEIARAPERPALAALPPGFAHPVVLLDPQPWTLLWARSLRAHGARVVLLSEQRLEPALHTRGVQRRHLPALQRNPQRWEAALVELAAGIEPRAIVYGCSGPACDFLRRRRRSLLPHFTLADSQVLDPAGASAEEALRAAIARCEPALEVQLVRDAAGRRTGLCVLAWAPGAPPDVCVTSVEGTEVANRSALHLEARGYVGYARLVWGPDRFGRLGLQAASPLPGASLALAAADGVDFPPLAYAAVLGATLPPARALVGLTRRLVLAESATDDAPLVDLEPALSARDPLPWLAGLLRSLTRL